MKYARIADGRVAEVIELEGIEPAQVFHPDIAATIVRAGGEIEEGWSYAAGTFTAPPPGAPPSKAELTAYAADRRWRFEVGGISFQGLAIATDSNSQTKILGAYVAASRNADWSTLWESVHPVDAATMIELGDAVQMHINRSFLKRAEVYGAIEDGTITSQAEVDAAFENEA